MMKVSMMDTTGQRALEGILHQAKREQQQVFFTRANSQVEGMLRDFQEEGLLSSDAIQPNTSEAIKTAMRHMDPEVCRLCKYRTFEECRLQPGGEIYQPVAASLSGHNATPPLSQPGQVTATVLV